ncbi:serine/threonine-protein kinase [Colwellia echini]|uniref:Protein kinase n=1 Tax=Colwellia echini TaxID=1982103 RepID=A0ABY3MXD3_9GAMM|nr:serine/threonine-protein kinase [Colwellia echini]TYK65860.1 protein kinase [Colwellia echini]
MDSNLPHYTRERLLGEGGMGKVYLAQDNQLQRQVAIKELTYQHDSAQTNTTPNTDQVNHALQEARLLARVNHTNIIQIYNVHDEGDHISLVMEYFQSKTLTQFQHETHSTLVQKLDLLQQLAAGLAAAHKNDVIHCDLKPTNILVNESGHLKITDFGIALIASNDAKEAVELSSNKESAPLLFGSLLFMSPEQIKQQALDYRSDIFSLGIIAYQLMVGSHPFGRGSATEIAERICNKQAEHAKNLMLNAPSALTDLLMEMLIQPLEQRTITASAIENRIKHIRTALLQAEISEQETMPLSADNSITQLKHSGVGGLSHDNITQEYRAVFPNEGAEEYPNTRAYQSTLTPQQGALIHQDTVHWYQKNTLKSLLSLLLICVIAITSFIFYSPQVAPSIQVVILKPTFNDSEKMAAMQQDLVISAVEDAMRQAVINTKNMYLISQREVNAIIKEYPDNLKKLKQAVGATDIIATELVCDNNRCKVHFSRLVASEKNNDSLLVTSEKNWVAPVDKFNAIFSTSQAQFASLFPEYSEINDSVLVQRPIKEEDYRTYLALYNQIKGQGNYSEESLTQLEELLIRSPYLYAAYDLYSETASNLYVDKRDEVYLKRLELILQKSPPEYRYSLYHAIDSFWLAFNMRDFEAAELQIKEARIRGANSFTLTELNGILFFSKGQFKLAVESFQKALLLRPSSALLFNLALSYWNIGDLKEAESILKEMLKITPNNDRAIRLNASIWLLQGRMEEAILAYKKLVVNFNSDKDISNLSLAYGLNKQYDKSLEFALKALTDNPNNPINLLNLADVEMIIGDKNNAIIYYKKVVEMLEGTNEVNYLIYLAQAYAHLNFASLAIDSLAKAQILAPDSSEVFYSSAVVYSLLGENSSAIYNIKLALKSNVGVVWFNLPWFDELCTNKEFSLLMREYNNHTRCNI